MFTKLVNKILNSMWLKAMAIRALRTMAQTALTMITIGAAVSDINWQLILSVSLVSGLYSVLTSIATKLPEVQEEVGTLLIDTTGEVERYQLDVGANLELLASQKKVTLKIDPNAHLSQE